MKLCIDIAFEVKEKSVTCTANVNNKKYVHTRRIETQADRIDSCKRAKQLAYLGCMTKIHGYVCDNINNLERVTN